MVAPLKGSRVDAVFYAVMGSSGAWLSIDGGVLAALSVVFAVMWGAWAGVAWERAKHRTRLPDAIASAAHEGRRLPPRPDTKT